MKLCILHSVLLFMFLNGCKSKTIPPPEIYVDNSEFLVKDSAVIDSIKSMIQLTSDRTFSSFKTPAEVYDIENGVIIDSTIESDFSMSSWYHSNKDTISIVAHVGGFETHALLLRFVKGKVNVSFFRAPHSGQECFRIYKGQPYTSAIAVPPLRYKLQLSGVPDTLEKPVVFGYIDMESLEYYDKRDSLNQKHKIRMKFYFRSQFRKFDYND